MILKRHSERSEESNRIFAGGHVTGFFSRHGGLRMTGIGILLLLGLLSPARAAEPEMRLSPRKIRDEVKAVVEAQLAALRTGDFATAYDFAAQGIRRQFDERLFAAMIRRGYPALLRPGSSDVGVVRDDGEGTAQVMVTVTDRQDRSTVYRYWLVQEEAGWRINGVVLEQRPPRGDI
jgi:hypothetical protein